MARKGPKIKELARELGVTSRRVLERLRQEGLAAQNSATRLDAATANRVRGWFGAPPAPDAPEPAFRLDEVGWTPIAEVDEEEAPPG